MEVRSPGRTIMFNGLLLGYAGISARFETVCGLCNASLFTALPTDH